LSWAAGVARRPEASIMGSMAMNRVIPKRVPDYIALFPKGTRQLLRKMRATIKAAAPGAREKISYGIPAFTLEGNLVHFAGYGKHIGFYPGAGAVAAFKKEISQYESAKGSVQFPLDRPLPLALISRIVSFRVKQNLAKSKKK